MKNIFIAFILFSNCSFAQDSTFIPTAFARKTSPNTTEEVWTHFNSIDYLPSIFQQALDSVYGSKLIIKDPGPTIDNKGNKLPKPVRETRVLANNHNLWLFTYRHREPDAGHIHFIIFTMTGYKVQKMTAGICEYDIDSLENISKRKAEKTIKFINLFSTKEIHKF